MWRQWHHWNHARNCEAAAAERQSVLTVRILTQGNMNLAYFDFHEEYGVSVRCLARGCVVVDDGRGDPGWMRSPKIWCDATMQ